MLTPLLLFLFFRCIYLFMFFFCKLQNSTQRNGSVVDLVCFSSVGHLLFWPLATMSFLICQTQMRLYFITHCYFLMYACIYTYVCNFSWQRLHLCFTTDSLIRRLICIFHTFSFAFTYKYIFVL